jgi:Tol biopolymer transport system component
MNDDLVAGLQRLADRADDTTMPTPGAIRAAGDRRTRRTAGLVVLAAAASVVVVLALLNLGSQPRADRQQPVKPPEVSGSKLTYWGLDDALVTLEEDGSQTPLISRQDLLDACPTCEFVRLAWSPDGTRAALVLEEPSPDTDSFGTEDSVWLWESGRLSPWFDCPGETDPSCDIHWGSGLHWSTDSRSLYFASESRIYSATLGAQPVLACDVCRGFGPVPSPDGQWIAFVGTEGAFRVPTAGGEPEVLTDVTTAYAVSWSPDGSKVLVDTDRGVYVLDPSGDPPTATLAFAQKPGEGPAHPTWSPDGRRFAFFNTPRVRGKFEAEVWVVDLASDIQSRRIVALGCCVYNWVPLTWSPDGSRLALQVELPPRGQHASRNDYVSTLHVFVLDPDTGQVLQDLPGVGPVEWRATQG